MKNLQSTTEGTWVELKQVSLTEEQKVLLMSQKEEDNVARLALFELIEPQRTGVALVADEKVANDKYDLVKPLLKETDVYQLISFDVTINEETLSGILNCRVSGEHKQIRF